MEGCILSRGTPEDEKEVTNIWKDLTKYILIDRRVFHSLALIAALKGCNFILIKKSWEILVVARRKWKCLVSFICSTENLPSVFD